MIPNKTTCLRVAIILIPTLCAMLVAVTPSGIPTYESSDEDDVGVMSSSTDSYWGTGETPEEIQSWVIPDWREVLQK